MLTWNSKWTLKHITVGNNIIGLSKSAKFLGVTLDSKRNFNEHIINTTKKATASLTQLRRAVGPTWGMSSGVTKGPAEPAVQGGAVLGERQIVVLMWDNSENLTKELAKLRVLL